ncbi:hypothetical protein C8R43DRAFT_962932 [Mycena crocata]|nr:hypothetical protein C8R43DRAFT_962932 [Mycena crocata]
MRAIKSTEDVFRRVSLTIPTVAVAVITTTHLLPPKAACLIPKREKLNGHVIEALPFLAADPRIRHRQLVRFNVQAIPPLLFQPPNILPYVCIPHEFCGHVPKASYASHEMISYKHLLEEIEFRDSIPKTPSGKIVRGLLLTKSSYTHTDINNAPSCKKLN